MSRPKILSARSMRNKELDAAQDACDAADERRDAAEDAYNAIRQRFKPKPVRLSKRERELDQEPRGDDAWIARALVLINTWLIANQGHILQEFSVTPRASPSGMSIVGDDIYIAHERGGDLAVVHALANRLSTTLEPEGYMVGGDPVLGCNVPDAPHIRILWH